ncbi:hypothetical protein [Saccharopolyspora spinosa]|nr:hypothetical protein [Saccharopolyspora spinosa]
MILNEAHARQILTEYQPHEANARTLLRTRVLDRLINEYRYAA